MCSASVTSVDSWFKVYLLKSLMRWCVPNMKGPKLDTVVLLFGQKGARCTFNAPRLGQFRWTRSKCQVAHWYLRHIILKHTICLNSSHCWKSPRAPRDDVVCVVFPRVPNVAVDLQTCPTSQSSTNLLSSFTESVCESKPPAPVPSWR